MDLPQLIEALSAPGAYPHPVEAVEVRQTHISAVFLAGPFAYKIKKPVNLRFLDFSTLERRRHFCEEEVRLNRRLAPAVYLGVAAVSRCGRALRVGGEGEVVEWAVKMTRLPDDATLEARLRRGGVGPGFVETLARKVARFHATAESGEHVASFGRFEVVAGNARENFDQAAAQVGDTVSAPVFERLKGLTESSWGAIAHSSRTGRGEGRPATPTATCGWTMSTTSRSAKLPMTWPSSTASNSTSASATPTPWPTWRSWSWTCRSTGGATWRGRSRPPTLARPGDEEGRGLLRFYTAYRAVVRAKVEGFAKLESEIEAAEREAALVRARPTGCWPSANWKKPDAGLASSWSAGCPGPANRPWRAAWPARRVVL